MSNLGAVFNGAQPWAMLAGDARDGMDQLPEHSVSMAVNSPPYYRLRLNGGDPTLWGADPDCEHEWLAGTTPGTTGGTASAKVRIKGSENFQIVPPSRYETCARCGAWSGELGQEPTAALYVEHLVELYAPLRRVLHPTATFWLNIGDTWNGSGKGPTGVSGIGDQGTRQGFTANPTRDPEYKPKDQMGIPWRVARALQERGWWVRSISPWIKRNGLGASMEDRPPNFLEWIIQLTPSLRYYYDVDAVLMPGKTQPTRFRRNSDPYFEALDAEIAYLTALREQGGLRVDARGKPLAFDVCTASYRGKHFSVFPESLIVPLVRASTSEYGVCAHCRAPWIRQVDRTKVRHYTARTTTDWRPSCSCSELVVPAIVLDPTAGVGSAGRAALGEGRRFIGIELLPQHAAEAERNLAEACANTRAS